MAMLSDDVIAEVRTVETHPLRVRFDRARFSKEDTLRRLFSPASTERVTEVKAAIWNEKCK